MGFFWYFQATKNQSMRNPTLILLLLLFSCKGSKSLVAAKHSYPNPVDTTTKPIVFQKKQAYYLKGLSATNDFPAARLNSLVQNNDSTYTASIWPENFPINPSPWYAFKLWSNTEREVYINLDYSNGAKHRYAPKISADGENWNLLDSTLVQRGVDSTSAQLKLKVNADTLWVAAQEIQDHRRVGDWVKQMELHSEVTTSVAGKSAMGRDLYHLNISNVLIIRNQQLLS